MKITVSALLFMIAFSACQFSKSVQKDLVSGLLTTGDGLSCENVFLTVNDEKTRGIHLFTGKNF